MHGIKVTDLRFAVFDIRDTTMTTGTNHNIETIKQRLWLADQHIKYKSIGF